MHVPGPVLALFRDLSCRILPRAVRVEVSRLRRAPLFLLERADMARHPASTLERAASRFQLAAHETPLERVPGQVSPDLQAGKEHNVALAARLIDGIVLPPGQVFSYHHAVGRPSRLRGFRPGLELHEGKPGVGVGGGCCAVSNLLYLLALRAGLKIVERHRHALDLFPDHGRTVPFGCGATVFYNRADLRFENPLSFPVILRLEVVERALRGRITSAQDPGFRVQVYEVDHRFLREGGGWIRENRLRRQIRRCDGTLIVDEEIAHNRARVAYQPDLVDARGVEACGGR